MPPTTHSSFSASSSARLLACPGSFLLGQQVDDGTRKSTQYSAEGTLAHAISEVCVTTGKDLIDFVGETRSADGFAFTVDDAFAEAAQVYVDYVRGLRALGFAVMLEQRVSPALHWDGDPQFPDLGIDLFGTADCVAYHPGKKVLVIGDLKFGAGVPVEAEANTQLLYYAAGAYNETTLRSLCQQSGVAYNGVDEVTLTVIQPRAFHRDGPVRRYTLSSQDLVDWTRTVLYTGVRRALNDQGQTLKAGTWCRFCPALAHCSEPARVSFQAAKDAFMGTPVENIPAVEDPGAALPSAQLTDDKLSELLDKIAIIEPWLREVKSLGQQRLEQGKPLTGWKLVPKRAVRKWAGTDDEVAGNLTNEGLNRADFEVSKLKTPAQVERAIGKKEYLARVAPHVVKASSGVTLASEGDPRTRVQKRSASAAFAINQQKQQKQQKQGTP